MNDHAPISAENDGVRIHGDGYTAEAGWFGPEDRPRFGWLYRPDAPATNGVGVVIVPPFGREDICAHRTLRHLAEDAARAGFVALRFDLDGTADSIGADTDPKRVDAWIASVDDACDLARSTGASSLVLVGVRLGATLATLSASNRKDVAALVAFNAVVSGKAYLRELRAFQMAMNLAPAPTSGTEAGQESSGFLFTEATCAALKAVDLTTAAAPPAAVVLVLERDDMPERTGWPEHLQSVGVDARVQRLAGYVDMLSDPHMTRVAEDFIAACLECARGMPPARNAVPASTRAMRPAIALQIGGVAVVEEVVAPSNNMFGILARPLTGANARAVLMLNAGAIRHIGSNRMSVPLARDLAASGFEVLRADLPGIGDSPAREGEAENVVYGPHGVEDAAMLAKWLHERGARHIAAGGMCSGAYHAFRGALLSRNIDRVYMINCGVFGAKVDFDPESASVLGDVSHYSQSVRSRQAWRRLLTGKSSLGTVARVAFWHAKRHTNRMFRELARRLRLPLQDDLGAHLLTLARRGTHMHLLFSEYDPGLAVLSSQAGTVLPRLRKTRQLEMQLFPGTNHTFTQRWAQILLHETLQSILVRQNKNAP